MPSLCGHMLDSPVRCATLGREVAGPTASQASGQPMWLGLTLLRPRLPFILSRPLRMARLTSTHHHRRHRRQCMQRPFRRLAARTAVPWLTLALRAASVSTLGVGLRTAFYTSRSSTHAVSCTASICHPLVAMFVPTARRCAWRPMLMLTPVVRAPRREMILRCHPSSIPRLMLQAFQTLCRYLRRRGLHSAA